MRAAALIGIAAFIVYWSTLRVPLSGDATTHVYLAYSFVNDGDADIAEYVDAPHPFVMNSLRYGDRVYSPYVPGNAMLFAPLALVAVLGGVPAPSLAATAVLTKLLASALTATAMALTFHALRSVARMTTALAVIFACAFGTYAFSVASQLYLQHAPTLALLALAMVLIVRGHRPALAGLPLGFAILVRPMNALFALAVIALTARSRREAARMIAWTLPGLAALAVYDLVLFGSPLALPGAKVEFASPLEGMTGLLASPSRGLLVYSPQLAFGLAGLALAWRWPRDAARSLLRAGSLAFVGALLLFGTYADWYSGWFFGNRYLADALPFLALAIAVGAERGWARSPRIRGIFAVTTAWAVALHAIGAGLYYFYWRGEHWDVTPEISATRWRLWDWSDTQWQWVLRRAVSDPGPALAIELTVLLAISACFVVAIRRARERERGLVRVTAL